MSFENWCFISRKVWCSLRTPTATDEVVFFIALFTILLTIWYHSLNVRLFQLIVRAFFIIRVIDRLPQILIVSLVVLWLSIAAAIYCLCCVRFQTSQLLGRLAFLVESWFVAALTTLVLLVVGRLLVAVVVIIIVLHLHVLQYLCFYLVDWEDLSWLGNSFDYRLNFVLVIAFFTWRRRGRRWLNNVSLAILTCLRLELLKHLLLYLLDFNLGIQRLIQLLLLLKLERFNSHCHLCLWFFLVLLIDRLFFVLLSNFVNNHLDITLSSLRSDFLSNAIKKFVCLFTLDFLYLFYCARLGKRFVNLYSLHDRLNFIVLHCLIFLSCLHIFFISWVLLRFLSCEVWSDVFFALFFLRCLFCVWYVVSTLLEDVFNHRSGYFRWPKCINDTLSMSSQLFTDICSIENRL